MYANKNNNAGPKKGLKSECTAYKYSNKGKGELYEAVILSGRPAFLRYENGKIVSLDIIEESSRIIKPPSAEEYPYEPHEFADMQEIKSYEEKCGTESLDSLYRRARCIVENYNDQDSSKLSILAVDIVWSYFQDKFSTTHYIGVVGDNGSGKSTIGDTFEAVGYRVVNMTDPTAANLFRILGRIEPGQCTLVADEAEKIDQSPEIMSTLKTGYQYKSKVARVNMNNGRQEFYYTYCFKMIIAERSPNETKAKGVLDRTFVFNTYHGRPKYDIKEILKPSGDPKRQSLLNELIDFRKLLLIYRLIHFNDQIADVDIGLEGRHKELCKPILQLFYNSNSKSNSNSIKEIEGAFQILLNAKNQKKSNSIEAALHPIIVNLVSVNGNEVFAGKIWDLILETIPGTRDDKKPNEYQTYDHGTIYRNTITNIICDKFGAGRWHRKEGTVLTFDPAKLVRIGHLYNLETRIQTKIGEGGEGGDSSEGSKRSSMVVTTLQSTGNEQENRTIASSGAQKSPEISTSASGSSSLAECFWPNDHPQSSVEPSHPSQPSPRDDRALDTETISATTARRIYRIHPHSDIFACENCRRKGDKWDMKEHHCRGNKT